jgi:signal transduction histidine kinase/ActR/RegA family two-component response regulator
MQRALRNKTAAAGLAGVALALIVALANQRDAAASLLPHGYCFTWNPALLWTHVVSDSLIGLAYVSIPLTLLHIVRRRPGTSFNWMFVLFAVFIVSCGATHVIEVWTVWHPDYWLSASVKVVTAVSSLLTAAALIYLLPRIFAMPTLAQMTAARDALEAEVASRRRAEQSLREERALLERRVAERTEALAGATATAEAAHAAAEEANKLKDRFLAKVSHELRTPLQSTLSWAYVLARPSVEPALAARAAERIMHNVRSQARLIDDLLDISRILSGKLGLELATVDAASVLHKAVEVVRSASVSRGVTIELAGDGAPAPMATDPLRLEQVVWNLINNAVQASPDGGRVRVRVNNDGTTLRVDVQDWGRGIDPVDLPHVFEPFRQSGATGGTHRGLGLGLAITRSIVELFGGRIEARSEGPGRGATFSLALPMTPAKVDADAIADAGLDAADRERLQGLRVLYVEDEADIGEAGRLMLAALGAQVELCSDFDAARERVAAGGFDILLSDLNLGGGHDAIELLAWLRRQPHGAHVPALVLSAYGRAEDRQASREAGFVAHLVKPAQAGDVARALVAAIAQRAGDDASCPPA